MPFRTHLHQPQRDQSLGPKLFPLKRVLDTERFKVVPMTLQPQTTQQSRCPHLRVTASGSNDVQERRSCVSCHLTFCMIHYARAPDDWLLQVLRHVRENRPHLWEEAARRQTRAEVDQAVRDRAARDIVAQNQANQVPPPEPHPASRPSNTRARTSFAGRLNHQEISAQNVVINLTTPEGEPATLGPQAGPEQ